MNNASSSSFAESFQRNHPSHVDLNKTQVRLFFQRNFSLRCEQQKKIAKQKQSKIWKMNPLKRDNDRMTTVKWDELKKGAPKTRIAMRNISCIWELARCHFWFVEKISKSPHFPRANHPFVWQSENFFFLQSSVGFEGIISSEHDSRNTFFPSLIGSTASTTSSDIIVIS